MSQSITKIVTARINVVSAHRDDAAFSIAGTLKALAHLGVGIDLLSCFTISNWAPKQDKYSLTSDISELREKEDEAFVRLLGSNCNLFSMQCVDAALREDWRFENGKLLPIPDIVKNKLIHALQEKLSDFNRPNCAWAIPVAYGHRDHKIAREASLAIAKSAPLLIYQDVPYCFLCSEEKLKNRIAVLEEILNVSLIATTIPNQWDGDFWKSSASCYSSQFSHMDVDEIFQSLNAKGGETVWITPEFDSWLRNNSQR